MVDRFQLPTHQKKEAPHLQFVESVRVRKTPASVRVKWSHAVLGGFWFLIAVKCLLAHWAIVHWEMPFNSIWVWGPTVFAALICTVVFLASGNDELEK